jgi:hypothetical protein
MQLVLRGVVHADPYAGRPDLRLRPPNFHDLYPACKYAGQGEPNPEQLNYDGQSALRVHRASRYGPCRVTGSAVFSRCCKGPLRRQAARVIPKASRARSQATPRNNRAQHDGSQKILSTGKPAWSPLASNAPPPDGPLPATSWRQASRHGQAPANVWTKSAAGTGRQLEQRLIGRASAQNSPADLSLVITARRLLRQTLQSLRTCKTPASASGRTSCLARRIKKVGRCGLFGRGRKVKNGRMATDTNLPAVPPVTIQACLEIIGLYATEMHACPLKQCWLPTPE